MQCKSPMMKLTPGESMRFTETVIETTSRFGDSSYGGEIVQAGRNSGTELNFNEEDAKT